MSLIIFTMWVLFIPGCQSETQQKRSASQPSETQVSGINGISKDTAIMIANNAALERHETIANFKIVACEQSIFWAIIYDGGNSETLIDKTSGKIVQVRAVPQGYRSVKRIPERIEGIGKDDAVRIARDNFRVTYGQGAEEDVVILTCELARSWRIVFDIKLTGDKQVRPDSHAPTYIIDKQTGELLYRQLY